MVNTDLQRIIHIKYYCEEIIQFLDRINSDYEAFLNDQMFFRAVSMNILQIGEIAGGLSDEYRKRTSETIPWSSIKGMRNILTHNYGVVDNEMLWNTVVNDIPKLLDFCNNELSVSGQ